MQVRGNQPLDSDYSARDLIMEAVKTKPKDWFEPQTFEKTFKKYNLAGSSASYINNTLNKLHKAGLLDKDRRGRKVFFRLR